jgi:serine/threonine protein kinase/tetratricopeptide (TPR) repeat protein
MPMPQGHALSTRFEIVRSLGVGGMGIVYEAIDRERDVRVALKTLRSFSPEGLARFKREFRAVEAISHRNLVSLGELVCEGDTWFFTMELLEGVDFIRWVRPRHRVLETTSAVMPVGPMSEPRLATTVDAPRISDVPREEARPSDPSELADVVGFDESRLRAAVVELARGLLTLHEAMRVHRDVKPSNVRVTPEGRVVVLDFGIVSELESGDERGSGKRAVSGTPAYMAPEQAHGDAATPAADWYSVGAMLYEALTGHLPFDGSNDLIVAQKQSVVPLPPSAIVTEVPADLERLCMDLLELDPARRPNGHEVLERLSSRRSERTSVPGQAPTSTRERLSPLVGRASELKALNDALDAARTSAVAALVHGESGIGKTALVRGFTDTAGAADRTIMVLHGQCREREDVPYKALDDVIDQLAGRLEAMPGKAVVELAPPYVGALLHVFPVLRSVRPFARHSEEETEARTLDARELRRRAFLALRALFGSLAETYRPIVVVDDLQWADQDSFALLGTLLRPPSPPPLLFVATVRTSDREPDQIPRAIVSSIPGDVRLVPVGPLSASRARQLAVQCMTSAGLDDESIAATIAADANGHPLFIDELARRVAGGLATSEVRLDDALWARIAELPPVEQTVAQLVALASSPLAQETVARAAELHARDFAPIALHLKASNFVRTGGTRATDRIEPYHDRVRETLVARLPEGRRRALHERLATALEEAKSADAEALALHWREAGSSPRAATYAKLAAEQAWNALAFDRAAQWYATTIELGVADAEEGRALHARLGEALGNAGRGAQAAAELQRAAGGADAHEAHDLERRAVEQLLRSGYIDEGLSAAERVLSVVGLKLPRSTLVAVVLLVFWRTMLLVRGLEYTKRDPRTISPAKLQRIDTCNAIGSALALTDTLAAWLFSTRALVLALGIGDPRRIVYPLASEGGHHASGGPKARRRSEEVLARAAAIAKDSGDDKAAAWVVAHTGYARYARGDYKDALELFLRAESSLQCCGAKGYEVAGTQFFLTNTLAILGRLEECCRRIPAHLAEARERDDLFAAVNFRTGFSNLVWLVADDPDSARRHLTEAMKSWSKRGFHVEHFYALLAGVNIALYVGDVAGASRLLEETLPAFNRSFFSRVQPGRLRLYTLRARVALARVRAGLGDREGDLRVAETMARHLARGGTGWSVPTAEAFTAAVARARGRNEEAVALLERARARFEDLDLALDVAIADYALGHTRGGEEGQRRKEDARRWLASQTIRDPERFAGMLAPGWDAQS